MVKYFLKSWKGWTLTDGKVNYSPLPILILLVENSPLAFLSKHINHLLRKWSIWSFLRLRGTDLVTESSPGITIQAFLVNSDHAVLECLLLYWKIMLGLVRDLYLGLTEGRIRIGKGRLLIMFLVLANN